MLLRPAKLCVDLGRYVGRNFSANVRRCNMLRTGALGSANVIDRKNVLKLGLPETMYSNEMRR